MRSVAFGLVILSGLAMAGPAFADSCWDHNGSVMRLKASGAARTFVYEFPRQGLAAAGIRAGTLLFSGERRGAQMSGLARVYSSQCRGEYTEYYVEGPIEGDVRIVMQGTRETVRNCQSTGNVVVDTLVFSYLRQC
jgi:hypothetical protein